MTAHIIPPDADLIALMTLSKQWDIEDALALRKARRERNSARSRKGQETLRARFHQIDRFSMGERNEPR